MKETIEETDKIAWPDDGVNRYIQRKERNATKASVIWVTKHARNESVRTTQCLSEASTTASLPGSDANAVHGGGDDHGDSQSKSDCTQERRAGHE